MLIGFAAAPLALGSCGALAHAYSLHVIDGRAGYRADNWLHRDPATPLRGFGDSEIET